MRQIKNNGMKTGVWFMYELKAMNTQLNCLKSILFICNLYIIIYILNILAINCAVSLPTVNTMKDHDNLYKISGFICKKQTIALEKTSSKSILLKIKREVPERSFLK